jgi:hypothetical protein
VRRIASAVLICVLVVCDEPGSASDLQLKSAAPEHVGLTLQQSPVLYYFVSKATTLPTRFTLKNADTRDVVADVALSLRLQRDSGLSVSKITGSYSILEWTTGGSSE